MIAPMGVWLDYFAAPSDDAAVATVDAPDGSPGGPAPPSTWAATVLTDFVRELAAHARTASG